jgi:hypothetical protein
MQKDGKKEFINSNLEIIIATEMGFLGYLKGKQIKFNPRPFSKPRYTIEDKPIETTDTYVDLHLEVARKVDEIIQRNETESLEPQPQTNIDLVEIRKNWYKKPISPDFKTDPQGNPVFDQITLNEDLFEVITPPSFKGNLTYQSTFDGDLIPTTEKPEEDDYKDTLIDKDEGSQKWLMGLGRIKVRSKAPLKETKKTANNGVTVVKKDLEQAKQDLEQKKKEIEEIERLAKEKEEELEKKKHERKEREKEKRKELKRKAKLEKQKEKEKKKEEQRRLEEQKKKEREEKEKAERLAKEKKLEEEKLAKQQKLEAERQAKEQKLKEKQLEKEQKEQKEVETPKTEIDYDDLIDTVAKKEEINDTVDKTLETKAEEKVAEPAPEVKAAVKEEPEIKTEEKVVQETPEVLDEDVRQALIIIDNLLEKLPEETIEEFVNSKDFAIYEKVVNKYKSK